jgi:hypothetical protein
MRVTIDAFRTRVQQAGLGNPYIIVQDFSPQNAKAAAVTLGADAISTYLIGNPGNGTPYINLAADAEGFWNKQKSTGAAVVPLVVVGYDRRPRVQNPGPWETCQQNCPGIDIYYQQATPQELKNHLQSAIAWTANNASTDPSKLILIYAWNENDEGGWLVPTLSEGTKKINALSQVLVPTPAPPAGSPTGGNNIPKGWYDGANCGSSWGWTCDADNYNQAVNVDFFADAPYGSGGIFIGSTTAKVFGQDLVNANVCGGTGAHRFVFDTPASVKDGKSHNIYAYPINIPSGESILLPGSPKTFTCASATSAPTPTPVPTPVLKMGDANGDGKVDAADYAIWLAHLGTSSSGFSNGDFNNDGKVDGIDYSYWFTNFGK